MAISTKNATILLSVFVAAGLIAAAFYFSSYKTPVADAGVTDELIKAYATKDTDADGLFDWQESLYASDPNNSHSIDPSMTDREAVDKGLAKASLPSDTKDVTIPTIPGIDAAPGSLTDQFARAFFEQYLTERGDTPPTSEEMIAFAQSASAKLVADNESSAHFKASDLTTTPGRSKEALEAYANAVLAKQVAPTSAAPLSELVYFYNYATKDDASALVRVRALGNSYKATAEAVAKIPVPTVLAAAHLRFVNALYRTGEATLHMGAADTDPLRAMIGLSLYATASEELEASFKQTADTFAATLAP